MHTTLPPALYPPKPTRKNKRVESGIVNAAIRWLWAHGCFVWRNNTGAYKPAGCDRYIKYGTPGSGDIIGVNPHGRFISIEAKTKSGRLSDQQELFRNRVQEKGGVYVIARSIEDLEQRKGEILA